MYPSLLATAALSLRQGLPPLPLPHWLAIAVCGAHRLPLFALLAGIKLVVHTAFVANERDRVFQMNIHELA